MMDATQLAEAIEDLLNNDLSDSEGDVLGGEVRRTSSFESALVLTSNVGLVVRMNDGSEFQVTVIQSRKRTGG